MLFIIWVIFSCSYGFAGLALYSDFFNAFDVDNF